MTTEATMRPILLAGLLPILALVPAGAAQETGRPNVVLIIADDMAWDDCGAFGNPRVRTPNIDRLAREGMRFDRAFVTASSCSPSRSSLITGRYHTTPTPRNCTGRCLRARSRSSRSSRRPATGLLPPGSGTWATP